MASGLIYKKLTKSNICYSYSIKLDLAKTILLTSILLGSLYSIELLIKNGISLSQLLDFE
ncbi:hypothetical protein BET04_06765 [Caminicella sporogenes]|nr:hypothetical protein BET04_06765 [Caminicella sporogenes]